MKPKHPKFLVKSDRWAPAEKATNTGEWPFTFGLWQVIIYPYVHDTTGEVMWLDPYIEHNHAFVGQNVSWHYLLPEWNPVTGLYDETAKMPFCLHCGVFMSKAEWEHFEKCREMVMLSVKGTNAPV